MVLLAADTLGTGCFGRRPRCAPNCKGLVCGDDGCGGSCGECGEATTCVVGQCVCAPDCRLKHCGEDGCGGSCGSCGEGSTCEWGVCACTPDCAGRLCGDDGCHGSCGVCNTGEVCTQAGACCEPICTGAQCGSDGCEGSCGECPAGYACEGNLCVCAPQCTDRACGQDGCFGSCGTCADWEICQGSGAAGAHCEVTGVACPGATAAARSASCPEGCAADERCTSVCDAPTCTCQSLADCPEGAAACAWVTPEVTTPRLCLAPCAADPCPAGLECVSVWQASEVAQACGVEIHAPCRPCASDTDCQASADRCVSYPVDGQKRCFASCPEEPGSCPQGWSCLATADGDWCMPPACAPP